MWSWRIQKRWPLWPELLECSIDILKDLDNHTDNRSNSIRLDLWENGWIYNPPSQRRESG